MPNIHSFISSCKSRVSSLSLTTPVAIILAALILGGSHVVYGMVANRAPSEVKLFTGRPIDKTDQIEGTTKNNIFLVEYSDPECPYCISLHPTLKQIRNEYGDKIAFVYRHFPLTQIHPNAFDESKAIHCAGTLGGTKSTYAYVDALYGYKLANNTAKLPATGKEDIAANVGLDKEAFKACMASEEAGMAIDASLNDGVQAGVQGTPTSFILAKTRKGYEVVALMDGGRPYEYVKAAVEEALSR